jgi:hypothetical protein
MPIILLSKHAHRSDVHIHAEPDESAENLNKSAPGQAVDNHFYNALGAQPWRDFFKDEKRLKALKAKPTDPVKVGLEDVTRDDVGRRIFVAASKTYRWMWGDMQDKLKKNMPEKEAEYYNEMAEVGKRDKSTHHLKESDLTAAISVAVRLNAETMETQGAGFDPTV